MSRNEGMEITRTVIPVRETTDLRIWRCIGCGVVHMAVGEMIVNFDRDEFRKFTESVVDTHCCGWLSDSEEFSVTEPDRFDTDAEYEASNAIH